MTAQSGRGMWEAYLEKPGILHGSREQAMGMERQAGTPEDV